MSYSAIAVANYFIDKSLKTGVDVTNMKLQKLVYFAHAVYMKSNDGEPLILDPVIAMQHGPVIMSLYQELKQYGKSPITSLITIARPTGDDLFAWQSVVPVIPSTDTNITSFLDFAWGKLSPMTAWQLRTSSHDPGGAWYKTVESQKINPNSEDELRRLPRNLTILDKTIQECGR